VKSIDDFQAAASRRDHFSERSAALEGRALDPLNRSRNLNPTQRCATLKSIDEFQAAVSPKYHFSERSTAIKGIESDVLN
jgi:hypothetical protein